MGSYLLIFLLLRMLNITWLFSFETSASFPSFRFLGCSFVTSAVQRSAGQEAESWSWKNKQGCFFPQCSNWCFYLPPVVLDFLSVDWSMDITFPLPKHIFSIDYLCIFKSKHYKVLYLFCLPLMWFSNETKSATSKNKLIKTVLGLCSCCESILRRKYCFYCYGVYS